MTNPQIERAFTEANNGTEFCSSWLTAYIDHQRFSESPTSFHFWTGVSVLAGALRRRVWINELHFQWTPNMYIVLVGPAGVAAKSTSLRQGLSLLENVKDVSFGPRSMTWQALIKSFVRSRQDIIPSGSDRPVPMSCLTIGVSELGTFLDPKNRELVDLLTDMWDGQLEVWRRETAGEGATEIHNPWLNLIACTTPSWLRANFPEDLVGGGLTSRIVFVYEEKKEKLVPYPSELILDEDYKQEEQLLIHDLQKISELCGEYRIEKEAIVWGDAWYRHSLNGGLPQHLASGRFDGYVARKQSHVHKLAIILAAAKRSELIIKVEDLKEAERHISSLESSMLQVFNSIGVAKEARVTSELVTLIKNHKSIDYQALFKLCINTHKPQDFQESVKAAIEAGIVKKEKLSDTNWNLTYVGGKAK